MEKSLLLFAAIAGGNPDSADFRFNGVSTSSNVSLTFSAIDSESPSEVATVRSVGMPEVPPVVLGGQQTFFYQQLPVRQMQTYYPVQRTTFRDRWGVNRLQMGDPFPFGEGVDCFGGT